MLRENEPLIEDVIGQFVAEPLIKIPTVRCSTYVDQAGHLRLLYLLCALPHALPVNSP